MDKINPNCKSEITCLECEYVLSCRQEIPVELDDEESLN